ncbi:MAG: Transcriptional regulator, LuxR family [Variovorax sp.]|nr:Transcriptional regulator, LuxR family [Variovorax sp.]
MYLSASEHHSLRAVFSLLAEDQNEREVRERLGPALMQLLRADQFASFRWDAQSSHFGGCVAVNMDPANLARYDQWHQHHDPITFVLQSRRRATLVTEVMPQRELMRTPFFNDFLARDKLHWGMNLHAFDGDGAGGEHRALGDLRIWRTREKGNFGPHEKALLDLIEPAFIGALLRARQDDADRDAVRATDADSSDRRGWSELSPREQQVARSVCRGLTDKEIARAMQIGLPTVRTYLRRIFVKLGIGRRSALARWTPPGA